MLPGQCTASVGASAPALGRPPVPLTAMLCATMCACVGVVLAMLMWRGLRGWRPPPKRTRLEVSRSAEATAATACPPTPEATAINAVCKGGDETGAVDACSAASWPETPTTLALAQRVEALGLHLGDICVTGISVGLPNGCSRRRVFDPSALDDLFSGQTMIGPVPHSLLTAQLDRNVVQVSKGPAGDRVRKPLSALHEVVQLASRIGHFDLADEFGIDPKIVETLDSTYALAIGAGLQALLDAGLVSPPPSASPPPQGPQNNNTGGGAHPTAGHTGGGGIRGDKPWRLKPSHQEETGVIFASSFPALDSLVDEVSRFLTSRLARACDGQRREMAAQLECLARELGEKEGGPVSELREALIGAARPRGGAGSAGGGEAGGGCVGEGYSGAGGGGGGATCAEGCEDQAGTGALGAVCAADAGNGHDTGREGLRVGVILGGSGGVNGRGGGMNGGGVTGGGLNGGRVNGGGTGGSEGSASGSGAGDGVSPPEYEFNRKLLFKLLVMANSQVRSFVVAVSLANGSYVVAVVLCRALLRGVGSSSLGGRQLVIAHAQVRNPICLLPPPADISAPPQPPHTHIRNTTSAFQILFFLPSPQLAGIISAHGSSLQMFDAACAGNYCPGTHPVRALPSSHLAPLDPYPSLPLLPHPSSPRSSMPAAPTSKSTRPARAPPPLSPWPATGFGPAAAPAWWSSRLTTQPRTTFSPGWAPASSLWAPRRRNGT